VKTLFEAIKFVLEKAFKATSGIFIVYLTIQVILALTIILNIFIFKQIIDAANNQRTLFGLSLLGIIVFRLIYEMLAKAIEKYGEYLQNILDVKLTLFNNAEFVDKLSTLDISSYENPQTHDLIWRALNRVQWHIKYYLDQCVKLFTQAIALSASVAIFFFASPIGAIVIVLANIAPILVKSKIGTITFNVYKADSEIRRRFEYTYDLITNRDSLIEIKGFLGFPFLKKRLLEIYQLFSRKQIKVFKLAWMSLTFVEMLPVLAIFIFLLIMVNQLQTGQITTGTFVFLFTNIFVFSSALSQLSGYLASLISDQHFILEAIDYFKIKPAIDYPLVSHDEEKGIHARLTKPEIVVENLSFQYPNSDRYVLKNLNVTIPFSQNVALIGENGAGKTTLVKLLLRVYDPTEGRILINGIDLKEVPEKLFFKVYSTLFQSFGKFYLTIRENLQLASGDKLTDEEYIRALKLSNAWNYVKDFPKTLDQQLGPTYKDGVDLSGGQWQQLAIAKAYVKNTPVIILDEPTSAIDAKSETEIFDRLNRETKNKTLLFISHRFSTIKDAERIIVLDKGKIIEDGNHLELMQNDQKYAKLYTMQAVRYKREEKT